MFGISHATSVEGDGGGAVANLITDDGLNMDSDAYINATKEAMNGVSMWCLNPEYRVRANAVMLTLPLCSAVAIADTEAVFDSITVDAWGTFAHALNGSPGTVLARIGALLFMYLTFMTLVRWWVRVICRACCCCCPCSRKGQGGMSQEFDKTLQDAENFFTSQFHSDAGDISALIGWNDERAKQFLGLDNTLTETAESQRLGIDDDEDEEQIGRPTEREQKLRCQDFAAALNLHVDIESDVVKKVTAWVEEKLGNEAQRGEVRVGLRWRQRCCCCVPRDVKQQRRIRKLTARSLHTPRGRLPLSPRGGEGNGHLHRSGSSDGSTSMTSDQEDRDNDLFNIDSKRLRLATWRYRSKEKLDVTFVQLQQKLKLDMRAEQRKERNPSEKIPAGLIVRCIHNLAEISAEQTYRTQFKYVLLGTVLCAFCPWLHDLLFQCFDERQCGYWRPLNVTEPPSPIGELLAPTLTTTDDGDRSDQIWSTCPRHVVDINADPTYQCEGNHSVFDKHSGSIHACKLPPVIPGGNHLHSCSSDWTSMEIFFRIAAAATEVSLTYSIFSRLLMVLKV